MDDINQIIKNILKSEVSSQNQLKRILFEQNKIKISKKRLRMICLKIPEIKIITETKIGKIPDVCPCCFSLLKRFYIHSLSGKPVLTKLECKSCGYVGINGKWAPRRYRFVLKHK